LPPRRRPAATAVLALASVLVAFAACELAARLLLDPPRYHDAPLELDAELGFRGVPGWREELRDAAGSYEFALNAQGLRGRELPGSRRALPAAALRVVFLGDSFLVGQALRAEELVSSRVEAALRTDGREALVFNLSAIDWGTGQELLALRSLGAAVEPDAVVLFLYPANDLVNNSPLLAQRTDVSAGDPIRPYVRADGGELRVEYASPWRAWLRRHSRVFAALERGSLALGADPGAGESFVERLRRGRAPREDLEIFRRPADPQDRWSRAWQTTFALLRAVRSECDAMGARLLVVVVPSVHQVVATPKAMRLDALARRVRGAGLDALLDWDLPERELARFFAAEGIESVALLELLRAASARGERTYTRDEHLSARGHEIAAQRVERWLRGGPVEALAPRASAGGPVSLLPEASLAPPLLDFRDDPRAESIGDGWLRWTPPREPVPGAWLIGPNALAVLPAADGDLVVRGRLPQEARLPVDGQVAIVGGPRLRFRIERHGAFDIRLPSAALQRGSWPLSDGYVAIILAPGETHRIGATPAGLFVEELGFDAAAPRSPPGGGGAALSPAAGD